MKNAGKVKKGSELLQTQYILLSIIFKKKKNLLGLVGIGNVKIRFSGFPGKNLYSKTFIFTHQYFLKILEILYDRLRRFYTKL